MPLRLRRLFERKPVRAARVPRAKPTRHAFCWLRCHNPFPYQGKERPVQRVVFFRSFASQHGATAAGTSITLRHRHGRA
jgi:hypothetical protein